MRASDYVELITRDPGGAHLLIKIVKQHHHSAQTPRLRDRSSCTLIGYFHRSSVLIGRFKRGPCCDTQPATPGLACREDGYIVQTWKLPSLVAAYRY